MVKLLKTLSVMLALTVTTPALADYAAGAAAFKARDYATAKIEFEALPDDASALYRLGLMYMNGLGVDIDQEQGRGLVLKSADLGFTGAQLSMGKAYEKGLAVEIDIVKAYYYYSLAGKYSSAAQKSVDELEKTMSAAQLAESSALLSKLQ